MLISACYLLGASVPLPASSVLWTKRRQGVVVQSYHKIVAFVCSKLSSMSCLHQQQVLPTSWIGIVEAIGLVDFHTAFCGRRRDALQHRAGYLAYCFFLQLVKHTVCDDFQAHWEFRCYYFDVLLLRNTSFGDVSIIWPAFA